MKHREHAEGTTGLAIATDRATERHAVTFDVFQALVNELAVEISNHSSTATSHGEFTPAERDALRRGGFNLEPFQHGPDSPLVRSAAKYAALLDTAYDVADAAVILDVDPSRVRQRLAERSLWGVKVRGHWLLPRFQFDDTGPLPGIEVVFPRVRPDIYLVGLYNWFMLPDPDLEVDEETLSPRDWLRARRDPHIVASLAAEL